MPTRREAISTFALGAIATCMPYKSSAGGEKKREENQFRYCLNTSTISGKKSGLKKYIEIAARAGYDGIEIWIRDVKAYIEAGNSLKTLKKYIDQLNIKVESAIGFAPWMTGGEAGMKQMREEMEILSVLGCHRIAAPPAGVHPDKPLDFFDVGKKYKQILQLGRQTGVMPQLEFWGAHKKMWHIGQALMVAACANDSDARLLPDIYHLFRGNSGFESLKMLNGQLIEIFHINDYPGDKPRTKQNDADRVYPGDGVAPLKQVLTDLKNAGGEKVLSLELFNRTYWQQDPLEVAKIGLRRMKASVAAIE